MSDLAPLWGLRHLAHLDLGNNRVAVADHSPLGRLTSPRRPVLPVETTDVDASGVR